MASGVSALTKMSVSVITCMAITGGVLMLFVNIRINPNKIVIMMMMTCQGTSAGGQTMST